MQLEQLEKLIKQLSPELQSEVKDFVEFLLQKNKITQRKKLSQRWAGSLSEYKNIYSSIQLQKKALDWRDN
ncbi:MAG: DUF2281 domain-containing protein [Spirochaetes bacterium]|nr:DUF2281 domain-containing protein [Spirochaetota bacterium]